mmetsp:Transcript_14507/g.22036  ORF Transcript_14507/g.22036 Transcript_14507/m.22036 type:complete len:320 (-) Transcript_14507:21-980(-)
MTGMSTLAMLTLGVATLLPQAHAHTHTMHDLDKIKEECDNHSSDLNVQTLTQTQIVASYGDTKFVSEVKSNSRSTKIIYDGSNYLTVVGSNQETSMTFLDGNEIKVKAGDFPDPSASDEHHHSRYRNSTYLKDKIDDLKNGLISIDDSTVLGEIGCISYLLFKNEGVSGKSHEAAAYLAGFAGEVLPRIPLLKNEKPINLGGLTHHKGGKGHKHRMHKKRAQHTTPAYPPVLGGVVANINECDNACFGRCGPGCRCWPSVCGDCNSWRGCWEHDCYCSCDSFIEHRCFLFMANHATCNWPGCASRWCVHYNVQLTCHFD